MRKRDMHILSAGILMYTSDLRFQVIHPDKSENWTLQIKSPQQRDSGVYECQVSTEPKMYLNYTLNVVGECILNYSSHLPTLARIHTLAQAIVVVAYSLLRAGCLKASPLHFHQARSSSCPCNGSPTRTSRAYTIYPRLRVVNLGWRRDAVLPSYGECIDRVHMCGADLL